MISLSSSPPEQVREIRTLGGCLLYGGYKVLSVLNDSETVIASSSGEDEAKSTRDSLSHTLYVYMYCTGASDYSCFYYRSPYPLPYYGFNPVVSTNTHTHPHTYSRTSHNGPSERQTTS